MKLNKKGFTLIELLAALVIISLIMAIMIPVGTKYYNTAKNQGEKVFIEKLNKLIDDYIALSNSKFRVLSNGEKYEFKKCKLDVRGDSSECEDKKYYANQVGINDSEEGKIPFQILVDERLISEGDFINPYDKQKCKLDKDANNYIEIFQDEDKVNYFRYKLECIKAEDNKGNDGYIYNNVPSS